MGTAFLSVRGPEGETLLPLENPVTIGSGSACEIRLKGAAPRHAQVVRTPEGHLLRDLTGQGLVSVNGKRVARHLLQDGDSIEIGSDRISFTGNALAEGAVARVPLDQPPAPAAVPRKNTAPVRKVTARAPAPHPPAGSPRRWPVAVGAGAAAVLLAGAVILFLPGGGPPAAPAPARKAAPRETDTTAPARAFSDDTPTVCRLASTLNLLTLAAHLAAFEKRDDSFRELRRRIPKVAEEIRFRTADWPAPRVERTVPEHFREGDVLTHFDHEDLERLERPRAARLLADSLSRLGAGSRIRVGVVREGKKTGFTVFFEELPAGWEEILRLAGLEVEGPAAARAPEPGEALPEVSLGGARAAAPPARFSPGELAAFVRDPARRASTPDRAALAAAIRASGIDSDVLRVVALWLSRPEASWNLSPAASSAWEAVLAKRPWEKADEALAKTLLEPGSAPLLRLAGLAQLSDLAASSPALTDLPGRHGFQKSADGTRWGDPETLLHVRIARSLRKREGEETGLESALASGSFGARYAALVARILKALERKAGSEPTFLEIVSASPAGGPRGAAEHLRALAESFRKAMLCKDCKGGRVPCDQCKGKARVDLPCAACGGAGRVLSPGAIDGAQVTHKCRNCDGRKIFREARCPGCSAAGSVECATCGGRPWRDSSCENAACRNGWVPDPACRGKGRVDVRCRDCDGTGRVMSPGAVGDARVTQKCRTCNENHGVFKLGGKCEPCTGTGLVRCPVCEGKPGFKRVDIATGPGAAKRPGLSGGAVFSTAPCGDCAGEGWLSPRIALACPRCAGLGVRIRPASDPAKILD